MPFRLGCSDTEQWDGTMATSRSKVSSDAACVEWLTLLPAQPVRLLFPRYDPSLVTKEPAATIVMTLEVIICAPPPAAAGLGARESWGIKSRFLRFGFSRVRADWWFGGPPQATPIADIMSEPSAHPAVRTDGR